jgi:hypothetical protein
VHFGAQKLFHFLHPRAPLIPANKKKRHKLKSVCAPLGAKSKVSRLCSSKLEMILANNALLENPFKLGLCVIAQHAQLMRGLLSVPMMEIIKLLVDVYS